MALEIKGWVGNLGKYNEGELVGEWVTFPIDEDEWEEVMKRIGIGEWVDPSDELYGIYEEIFFADYDSELPLYKMFGEYPQWETLNELAEDVADADEDVLTAIMDYEVSFDNAMDIYKSGNWCMWSGCDSMADVARQIVSEDPAFVNAADLMQHYFDFDAYGRTLDTSGTFVPCGDGYLEIW